MLQKVLTIILTIVFASVGYQNYAQMYEVSYELSEQGDKQIMDVYMRSTKDENTRIRAINFSLVYDSTCSGFSSYTCYFAESWTAYLERGRAMAVRDTVEYKGVQYNKRWIFGTAEMINTTAINLPSKSEKPAHVLTIKMDKVCSEASLYLEDEGEYRVNQMGDINLRPAPWVIIR